MRRGGHRCLEAVYSARARCRHTPSAAFSRCVRVHYCPSIAPFTLQHRGIPMTGPNIDVAGESICVMW
ncbi:hypothetical protein NDU88_001912 [Pleurodeles waltl]|uniref:Uncharacterized protein n=1 Tax=Pleurodeles waltl TaxID=8319 RepID=A0AAV7R9W6_PLEWA|nr:hypothetical protein NDU88_001912 [Pleurodeles waltl]